jgi:hypothetical protein
MLWNGQYKNVKKRLNDWLKATSDNVGDLALDLTNRGQAKLWAESDWEPLIKRATLTVVNKAATLPTDFGKVINIYFDPFGYGKPIGYFNKDGDLIYGYKITTSFAKATGHAQQTITFFWDIQYTPILVYKAVLEALTGSKTGDTENEYLFFPENLVTLAAQLVHCTENVFDANEYKLIEREYLKELAKYKSQVQGVNADYRFDIKDDSGNRVRITAQDSSGGQVGPRLLSPSQDVRWGV